MSLDWKQLLVFAGAAGILSAAVAQGIATMSTHFARRSDHRHQQEAMREERNHARRMRQAEAHAKAREEMIDAAADATAWLEYEYGTTYGPDLGEWYPTYDPKPAFVSVTEVIGALLDIERKHPTKEVRLAASSLRNSISAHYGSIVEEVDRRGMPTGRSTGSQPSDDDFAKWTESARELVELMHEPPVG